MSPSSGAALRWADELQRRAFPGAGAALKLEGGATCWSCPVVAVAARSHLEHAAAGARGRERALGPGCSIAGRCEPARSFAAPATTSSTPPVSRCEPPTTAPTSSTSTTATNHRRSSGALRRHRSHRDHLWRLNGYRTHHRGTEEHREKHRERRKHEDTKTRRPATRVSKPQITQIEQRVSLMRHCRD